MSESQAPLYTKFLLPLNVVSRVDLSRLVSELEAVDGQLTAAAVQAKAGVSPQALPALSARLAGFLSQNRIALDNGKIRTELIRQLRLLKDNAPVIHMTFAVEADPASLQQLVQWARSSIHPQAIIAVGLQPGLVAGVYLRTPNHVIDLSLRHALDGSHELLVKELESLRAGV